ncbi:hypothetical protein N878_06140 [Pseudomonas sp. EGD-AK9]|uniref:DUF7507 domain-containing protein n=1 Tax=Pseudomonas sp. EGD-AK9 TaxID=1386078 RepID=UPI000397D225|nr:hypothetical protein [Pseudomonas sp. EGD-AK9]ERI51696.1 hypothetical protein N878_06140 [Pseudomonas sp. EGD-AK9]
MHTLNSWQTLLRFTLGAVLVGGMTSTVVNAVDGNPPGLFELDANTVDAAGGGDDWGGLYSNPPGSSVAFTTILADPAPLTIFTGGGSKDILDIPNWRHTNGSVPDKDDITNAYAAAYINPGDVSHGGEVLHKAGDMIIYFGLDRFANNGDAHAAFWFFQNDVGLNPNGTFVGQHAGRDDANGKRGDLMVLVEYPQGSNAVPEIKVYEWDPLGQGNVVADNLSLLFSSTSAKCDGSGNKLACATTNTADLPLPAWPYAPKLGNKNRLPAESFFEGGVNVSALLGGNVPCFSSFLAETRSSRSETAQLKDFVLGNFDVCAIEVTKECEAALDDETFDQIKVSFGGVVTNTGALTLFDIVVKDDMGTPDPSDDETIHTIAELAPGASEPYTGEYVTTSLSDPLTDTVTVTGKRNGTTVSDQDTAECPPPPIDPSIEVAKLCESQQLNEDANGIDATFLVTVTNTGNVKLTNVSATDTTLGVSVTLDKSELLPGESATGTVDHSVPFAASVTDSAEASGTAALSGELVTDVTDDPQAECALDVEPSIAIEKVCTDATAFGQPIHYSITVTNNGTVQLVDVEVVDDKQLDPYPIGTLNPGESEVINDSYTPATAGDHTNTATVEGFSALDQTLANATDSATCNVPPPGGEGCTPGFWKNSLGSWAPTGYSPNQTVGSVFSLPAGVLNNQLSGNSLLQALNYGGGDNLVGAAQILLRAAVASILNAAHPDTDFPRTAASVITDVNAALATKDRTTILALATALDIDNNLGCDLPNDSSF